MKRVPSNQMPEPPSRSTPWWGWIVLLFLGGGFFVATFPAGLIITAVLAVGVTIWTLIADRGEPERLKRLAADRREESICTFVRSFDFRSLDTWILRAVYEEVGAWTAYGGPIRPGDAFNETLRIEDEEDFEDLVVNCADRAGRSLDSVEQNPYYGRLQTVEDLVHFLHHQPRAVQPA